MPHLQIKHVTSEFVAIVTKGYEDIIKETLAGVLQSFHEKSTVTILESGSPRCSKFVLNYYPCKQFLRFGYPEISSRPIMDLDEFHVVLLEEMHRHHWKLMPMALNYHGQWTFQYSGIQVNGVSH